MRGLDRTNRHASRPAARTPPACAWVRMVAVSLPAARTAVRKRNTADVSAMPGPDGRGQFIASGEVLVDSGACRPMIVGGAGEPTQRAVVATASYEEQNHGVHSRMPLRTAARRWRALRRRVQPRMEDDPGAGPQPSRAAFPTREAALRDLRHDCPPG